MRWSVKLMMMAGKNSILEFLTGDEEFQDDVGNFLEPQDDGW